MAQRQPSGNRLREGIAPRAAHCAMMQVRFHATQPKRGSMSRHILDNRTPALEGLRLSKFARLHRTGISPQIRALIRRADPRARARLREFLRIARSEP